MSLYVRLQISFWTHRKTIRLRVLIGDAAYWIPQRLWCYAASNQPDGDFTEYSAEEISMLVAYDGNAQAMLQALRDTGFMDGMKIHDWETHNGYHSAFSERAKKAATARWGTRKERIGKDKKGKEPSIASSMLGASESIYSPPAGHSPPPGLKVVRQPDSTSPPRGHQPSVNHQLNHHLLNQVKQLFRKRAETVLDKAEQAAWKVAEDCVAQTDAAGWELLEWLFKQTTGDPCKFRRQNMATLLNNWNGEIEKARKWKRNASRV